MKSCPTCGGVFLDRLGTRLTPMQARLFDLVQRGREDGIPTFALAGALGIKYKTLKAHVNQLNDRLVEGDYRIRAIAGNYCLVREP
jgi:hypothetical protein